MKALFKKYWHFLFILFGVVYTPCFILLEKWTDRNWHIIHCALDDKIPFFEYVIIPYYLWFLFMGIYFIYFFFKSQGESVRFYSYIITATIITVIIFIVYPSEQQLRPETFPRDNFSCKLVAMLYSSDTPTNVLPSLHVLDTLIAVIAVYESKTFKHRALARIIASVCGFVICISTVLLKQHSMIDVGCAVALTAILYPIFYKTKFFKKFK